MGAIRDHPPYKEGRPVSDLIKEMIMKGSSLSIGLVTGLVGAFIVDGLNGVGIALCVVGFAITVVSIIVWDI